MSDTTFKDGDRDVNFHFAGSKSEPGIQIADVVIGFLGTLWRIIRCASS
ncbi:DUF3800 domain-containing protein [Trinickia symbiotica]